MFGATLGSRFDYWKLAEEDCPPRRLHATDPDENVDEDCDDIEIEDDDCDDDDLDEELLDEDEE